MTDPAPLRLLVCGSVDDGKSTLLGRLLYDAELVPADQLAEVLRDSRGRPTGPEGLDLSLLLDGLTAEREQGITIDVAYRYFATAKRSFIVADAPGHEQYTRNMATAASNSEAAVVLVDARKGILPQTRRHAVILSLMGIGSIALAVNKMDLVRYSETVFRAIADEFEEFAGLLGFKDVFALPAVALTGMNVVFPTDAMGWYKGPPLLNWLEGVRSEQDRPDQTFRMPVQWVNRPNADFRGLSGTVASGRIRPGDAVGTSSGATSTIARIVTMHGDLPEAVAGQAVTLVLGDDLDIGRGTMLFDPAAPTVAADQFAANVIWLGDENLLPHRSYLMRIGTELVPAEVTALKYRINPDDRSKHEAARVLCANEMGFCNVATAYPVSFDLYRESRGLGSFILVDRSTRATVGAGMIEFPLRRASNLAWQDFDISRERRAAQKTQQPAIVWFTGLSGSGKSTIANSVERHLYELGYHTFLIDGDNLRHGLNKDLGFTDVDRIENIRRAANVARLMADAGLVVLAALISPFRREREMAREIAGDVKFVEVFVDAPLSVCRERDPKRLYAKAAEGKVKHLTGVDSPYETPETPDLHLHTDSDDLTACVAQVLDVLKRYLQDRSRAT